MHALPQYFSASSHPGRDLMQNQVSPMPLGPCIDPHIPVLDPRPQVLRQQPLAESLQSLSSTSPHCSLLPHQHTHRCGESSVFPAPIYHSEG